MSKSEDFVSLISYFYRTCSLAIQYRTCTLLSSLLFLKTYNLAYYKNQLMQNHSTNLKNNIIPLNKYIIDPFGQEILLKVLFEAGYEPFSSHYLARNNQNCSRVKHYILPSVPDAKLQLLIFGINAYVTGQI